MILRSWILYTLKSRSRNFVSLRSRVARVPEATFVIYRCFGNKLSLENPLIQKFVDSLVKEFRNFENVQKGSEVQITERISVIKPAVDIYFQKQHVLECLTSLQELSSEKCNEAELQKQIDEEKQVYLRQIKELDGKLLHQLLSQGQGDAFHNVVMEITAGVGGQEAMLFARELYEMYCSYVLFKGWDLKGCTADETQLGGLRQASLFISGRNCYQLLKHEAGVHRVQRVPATEKSGRLHTSTVAVVLLPQMQEIKVDIQEKDLRIETKRASGAGGQHVNKTESAVRMTHLPTGVSVECQTDRSQIHNRKEAFQKLKAVLLKQKMDEQVTTTTAARKNQVKSSKRSEKIRTYNFNQDRITDHRISWNIHNLPEFMNGEELLDSLINKLDRNSREAVLFAMAEEANISKTI